MMQYADTDRRTARRTAAVMLAALPAFATATAITIATGAFPSAASAQDANLPAVEGEAGSTAQGDVAVTIYNNNLALVQDVRQLPIARGRSTVAFPDVSAQIRAETLSFAADGAAIVEQNFDFDLLTPQKLMEKAIGQTVTLIRTNPATGTETRDRAEVLSTAGGVVIRVNGNIEVLRDDGLPVRVIFDRVPPNLRARPTLSVTLESDRSGTATGRHTLSDAGTGLVRRLRRPVRRRARHDRHAGLGHADQHHRHDVPPGRYRVGGRRSVRQRRQRSRAGPGPVRAPTGGRYDARHPDRRP